MAFLTARWSNLCLVTYAVPPAMLAARVPPGLELDTRGGEAYVSLVAFDFLRTRVLGIPWPGYRDFPEINLRFYVRDPARDHRGVVFVREFVPKRLVAWLARAIYGEPYVRARMSSRVTADDRAIIVEHALTYGGRENRLRVTADAACAVPGDTSDEHFFKEHQWGYSGGRRGDRCVRYEVRHPAWACYRVTGHEIDWDFGAVYGPELAGLNGRTPCSVVLAAGSEISVHPKGTLAATGA